MLPLEILLSRIFFFFQILVLVNGEVDFTLSSICLYYKYNQVDVIFQIKYTTVLQKFFLIYGGWKGFWTFFFRYILM